MNEMPTLLTREKPQLGLGNDAELQAVLAAWHSATDRLQQTHETLRHEVKRLTDELEIKNRELARKNRLADLGQMAAHVAHEVRNNLVPLTLYLSLLRRNVPATDKAYDVLDKLEAGFTALEVIVTDLLQFTSNRDPSFQDFELDNLARTVLDSLAPQLAAQNIRTEIDIPARLIIAADRDMLQRATLNLVLNALDAMPQGGELVITGIADSLGVDLGGPRSVKKIGDAAEQRLFEPFFTTKRGGTGLGLVIVERIATAHGGSICVGNCPQGGAAFTIRIPYPVVKAAA